MSAWCVCVCVKKKNLRVWLVNDTVTFSVQKSKKFK